MEILWKNAAAVVCIKPPGMLSQDAPGGMPEALRAALGDDVSVHDFRMVAGPKHTKLIFDVLVPQALERSDADVRAMARKLVQALDPAWDAVVNVDRPYV